MSLETPKRPQIKIKSRKAKGHRCEQLIRNHIKEAFSLDDSDIRIAVGSETGMDIKLSAKAKTKFPFAVECKSRASFKTLYDWMQQAENNSEGKLVPIVVLKGDRKPPMVLIDFDYFLTLVSP